ncbi:MAG: YfiR family protein [Methylotenera sp.]|nr:YfiR family protein [Methylotenera sp.]
MIRFSFYISIVLAFVLTMSPSWSGEATVRLGFLISFSRFTTWPPHFFNENATMTICIVDDNRRFVESARVLDGHLVQGHKSKVILIQEPATFCNVLFLPSESQGRIEPYLDIARQNRTLTVSDRPSFLEDGGMIQMEQSNGRYLFDINLGAIRQSGLYVGTNLLKLARSVKQ